MNHAASWVIMSRRLSPLAASLFAAAAVLLPPAQAIPLYSINTSTDHLVRIDSDTGVLTSVGALGRDARDIDLALTSDGQLWGLNSGSGLVELWQINKVTGAVDASAPVKAGAASVLSAEGLASRGNQLKLSYDLTAAGNSITLADVSSAGAVTGGIVTTVDMDALADGHANSYGLYGFDRNPGTGTFLYGINPATGVSTLIQSYSDALGFHDLITLAGNQGIAIDTFADKLYRLDLTNGAVLGTTTIGTGGTGVFNGLALAEPLPAGVPDGASRLSVGLALVGLLVLRRRVLRR
jgi:hypothetical protein